VFSKWEGGWLLPKPSAQLIGRFHNHRPNCKLGDGRHHSAFGKLQLRLLRCSSKVYTAPDPPPHVTDYTTMLHYFYTLRLCVHAAPPK
jgi:hypothetical protein